MAAKEKFTRQEMEEAIASSYGIVILAAQKLDCDWDTVNNYCRRHRWAQAALDRARGKMNDLAESKLLEKIFAGDIAAIIFYCKTRMKDKGYSERIQLEPVRGDEGPRIVKNDLPRPAIPAEVLSSVVETGTVEGGA